MGDFIKKYDIITKLISLVSAIILWVYVMDETNPLRSERHDDIVVDLTSKSTIMDTYNLVVVSDEFPKVSVTVEGAKDAITRVLPNHIEASASLANITEPGEYELDYTVNLPFLDIEVEKKSPEKITVVVDEIVTKSFDVYVETKGEPQNDYFYNSVYTEEKVIITGPKTEVTNIHQAYVSIDIENNTENVNETLEFILVDESGNQIDTENLEFDKTSVRVVGQILKIKEVPLVVELEYGSLVPESAILGYEVTEPTVKIVGTPRNIDEITEVTLGTIEVDDVADGRTTFIFSAPLLDNASYYETSTEVYRVDLEVGDFNTKDLLISNFIEPVLSDEFTNTVEIKTQSIFVKMNGTESELEKVTASDIEIVALFDESELTLGEHEVEALVTITNDAEVEIMGEYTLVLEVS